MIGKIELFLGSMKSGKTGTLYQKIDRAKYRRKRICLIRSKIDTREFTSRTDIYGHKVDTFSTNKISDIFKELKNYEIICIDEGQFFEDLGKDCNELANNGKEIYIAALNGDSDMKPWNNISDLIPFCDNIFRASAICENCGSTDIEHATFTYFTGKKDSQISIGDGEYLALCRNCWNKRYNGTGNT